MAMLLPCLPNLEDLDLSTFTDDLSVPDQVQPLSLTRLHTLAVSEDVRTTIDIFDRFHVVLPALRALALEFCDPEVDLDHDAPLICSALTRILGRSGCGVARLSISVVYFPLVHLLAILRDNDAAFASLLTLSITELVEGDCAAVCSVILGQAQAQVFSQLRSLEITTISTSTASLPYDALRPLVSAEALPHLRDFTVTLEYSARNDDDTRKKDTRWLPELFAPSAVYARQLVDSATAIGCRCTVSLRFGPYDPAISFVPKLREYTLNPEEE